MLWCALTVCGLLSGGCERDAGPTSSVEPAAADLEIALNTPQDAARSLLRLLHAELQATACGDKALAAHHRDRVVEHVIARDDIIARYRGLAGRLRQDKSHALNNLVENWAAMIAYYVEGLELDQIKLGAIGSRAARAVVDVPAHGPEDEAVIRVACVRDQEDEWRVVGIEFALPEPEAPTTLATQPAAGTQPVTGSHPPVPGT